VERFQFSRVRIGLILVLAFPGTIRSASSSPSFDPNSEAVRRFLEDRVRADADDIIAQNRLAGIYLERLSENGGYEWLRRAREAVRRSLASVPADQNATGLFLQGRVEYESHHFAAARDLAARLTKLEPGKSRGFALLGDALLEFGDLDDAATAYGEMQKRNGDGVETESRFARLDLMRGVHDAAQAHFEKALQVAREASARSSQAVAWCLIQLGQLAFNTGQWDAAEKHFRSALAEQPDSFSAQEHFAELRAAQEKYDESIRLYEEVIRRTSRPEFYQALGDIYTVMGKFAEAASWHSQARAAYLENADAGNAHYFHHLAGLFADVEEKPAEALKWARRDLELRHTAAAEDALAWALYRGGQFAEAAEIANRVVARGTKDAHILAHAGMIFLAAGDPTRGKQILSEAARINPRHNSFHVHR
jgi:tetratricopeptide (TPR) repeat protein